MALFLLMLSISAEEQNSAASDWRAIKDQLWSLSGLADNKSLEAFNETLVAFDSAISQLQADKIREKREALEAKGMVLFTRGRYQAAIDAFDAAIDAADPEIPQDAMNALLYKGQAFMQLERFDEALESYDAASKINPPLPDPFVGMGDALKALGRPDEAIGAYQRALNVMEERDDVREAHDMLRYYMLDRAKLLAKLGRSDAALDTYDRAAAVAEAMVDPGSRSIILDEKANLLEAMGMHEKAGEVRKEIIGLSPQLSFEPPVGWPYICFYQCCFAYRYWNGQYWAIYRYCDGICRNSPACSGGWRNTCYCTW
jgi:tetratricopeptide (TPR) repeat protein